MNPQTIDPTIKTLVSAIGDTETGSSSPEAYTKRGASGEYGRYQFMPNTWKQWAPESGINTSLEQASIEEQNMVAYNKVKKWKDEGYNPAQIASMWNSGNPNAYKEGKKGVNEYGVAYDVPAYVQKVSQAYLQKKSGGNVPYNTTGTQTPETQSQPQGSSLLAYASEGVSNIPKETLGQQLGERAIDASEALQKATTGEYNPVSGGIQAVGAGAGAIGDVVSAGLRLIPGVEQVENWIGKGVAKGLETEAGQSILKSYADFAQNHPEAAGNIGAIGNIASVIPMVKGVALAAQAGIKGTEQVFMNSIKNSARRELEDALGRDIKGRGILTNIKNRNLKSVDLIIDKGYVPEVVEDANGIPRYSSSFASQQIDDALDLDEQKLQNMLEEATANNLAGFVPLQTMKQRALEEVKKELKGSPDMKKAVKNIEDDFDSYIEQYGELISLSDLNNVKRMVRKSVNFNSPLLEQNVRFHEGQAIMRMIEDFASRRGLKEVKAINKEMADKIEAQNILKKLDKKSVPSNPGWRDLTMRKGGETATIAGEAAGQAMGIPGAGAFIGKALSNKMIRGNKGSLQKLSRREGKRKPSTLGKLSPLIPILQGTRQEMQEEERQKALQ